MKTLASIPILLLPFSCPAPTFPNWFSTNTAATIQAPASGWLLGFSNSVPTWTLDGGALTNVNIADVEQTNWPVAAITNAGTMAYSNAPLANSGLANSTITLNGTATHITTTSATIALGGSATLDTGSDIPLLSGNNPWTGSNYFGAAVTGPTNANNTTPDFSLTSGASLLSTNAAFTFLTPTHLDTTKKVQQWIEILVTNDTALDIAIGVPAGCASVGTAHCTNLTDVWVMYYPFVCTNFYFVPVR